METRPYHRIVLTGAAGKLGNTLRPTLRGLADELVLSDLAPLADSTSSNETFLACDLADHAAMTTLLTGADAIVHFGGISQEHAFEDILSANLVGQFNIYDNALRLGIKRVVLASSNHVTGYYPVSQSVTPEMPMRPDGLYGVSKAYGELLAHYYHDRHGIESVCLRIGNCNQAPRTLRGLDCWLSLPDLCRLVACALQAPAVGFAVVYGVSANAHVWWHSEDAARIGYVPQDSSEIFRTRLETEERQHPTPHTGLQGGLSGIRDYRFPETLGPRILQARDSRSHK
jgi:uronate dehydrogenase